MDAQTTVDALIAAGMNEDDAKAAADVAVTVGNVDEHIFGEGVSRVLISQQPHTYSDTSVAYHAPQGGEEECYAVYGPGLFKRLQTHHQVQHLFLETVLGRSPLDFRWLLWAISCHEVRHRLQHHRRSVMRFFRNERQTHPDRTLRLVLEYVYRYLREKKRMLYSQRAKRDLIECCTGDDEFDGQVVEVLFLARVQEHISDEDLRSLWREVVLIEPPQQKSR